MNGRDTVTLKVGARRWRVRLGGVEGGAGGGSMTGDFCVTPFDEGNEPTGPSTDLRVVADVAFLWSADLVQDAEAAADRLMRTVGLLCVEAHLAGRLAPDRGGVLKVSTFIGRRYPDYTSVERFVGSLYDPPGRLARLCREDLLGCLLEHAETQATDEAPAGPGVTVGAFLAWPGKRRFYSAEAVRDAVLALEEDGLVETVEERVRIRPDRLSEARDLAGPAGGPAA